MSDSTETVTITVQYERKLSDGNYGSEGVSMALTMPVLNDRVGDALLSHAGQLRVLVLEQLAKSEAGRVSWAARQELNPPSKPPDQRNAPTNEPDDLEGLPF